MSGEWVKGLITKEAEEVEAKMWKELGMEQVLKDPKAITGGMNWYRYGVYHNPIVTVYIGRQKD